jgi:hypothetical protein
MISLVSATAFVGLFFCNNTRRTRWSRWSPKLTHARHHCVAGNSNSVALSIVDFCMRIACWPHPWMSSYAWAFSEPNCTDIVQRICAVKPGRMRSAAMMLAASRSCLLGGFALLVALVTQVLDTQVLVALVTQVLVTLVTQCLRRCIMGEVCDTRAQGSTTLEWLGSAHCIGSTACSCLVIRDSHLLGV